MGGAANEIWKIIWRQGVKSFIPKKYFKLVCKKYFKLNAKLVSKPMKVVQNRDYENKFMQK